MTDFYPCGPGGGRCCLHRPVRGQCKDRRQPADVFPCPYAPQDAATFVESCIRQEGRGSDARAIEVDGEAAGSIGLFLGSDVYRRSAELGYWLGGAPSGAAGS